MAQLTHKEGAVTTRCQAQINVLPTTDDQFVVIHIQTAGQQIELMLHIGEALEISSALEDRVQENIRHIESDLDALEMEVAA